MSNVGKLITGSAVSLSGNMLSNKQLRIPIKIHDDVKTDDLY